MKISVKKIRIVLLHTLRLLIGLQIIWGIAWIVTNLKNFQNFKETTEMLAISDSMLTDEYVGILYPVLIKAAVFIASWIPIPYYCYLYLLQLIAGFCIIYKLLEKFTDRLLLTLWIMTIPTVIQFYLAVLPQALAAPILLLCVYYCYRADWLRGGLALLASGFLIPEYFLFGGIFYVVELLIHTVKNKEERKKVFGKGILVLLIGCLIVVGVANVTVERYSRGRMARTPAAMLLHRMVWPNFSNTSYFWSQEVMDVFTVDDLFEVAAYPDRVATQFGMEIERVYGIEKAQDIYLGMAGVTMRIRTREITDSILADFWQYSVPMLTYFGGTKEMGASFAGWNYHCMKQNTPLLTKSYVIYSGNVFWVIFICALLYGLLGKAEKGAVKGQAETRRFMKRIIALSMLQAVWYTMSAAGMQDYKNVIVISIGWAMAAAFFLTPAESVQTENENCHFI